ncbi:MAG: SPOR domain-containing protein [Salibacteraceae bacterium]
MSIQRIDSYIYELLFEHDCVIIPGFGGLVANPAPAKLDRLQHRFRPPSKEIGFNRNLKQNDGLLANHLAASFDIGYQEALKAVDAYVQHINEELRTTGTFQIGQVGTLFFDQEKNYRFEPDTRTNFRLDSFGLGAFHSLPVQEAVLLVASEKKQPVEPVKSRRSEPFVDQPSIPPVTETVERKRRRTWVYVPLATVLLLILGYLVWLPTQTEVLTGENFHYSDLNPFGDKICPVYTAKAVSTNQQPEVDPLEASLKGNRKAYFKLNLFEEGDPFYQKAKQIWVAGFQSKAAIADSTRVAIKAVPRKRLRFHLIAGCFGERQNADRLVETLQQQGFQSYMLDQNKGLHRVSLQSFATRKEALQLLGRLRKENRNSGTWLLIK